ncbi:MAG: glycosyltransferase family 9 protein [bacterium]|nr:glycosyltransferase family 9 protein [bacterium]
MSAAGAILVIRLSSLGDVLLCAPALRALRRRFPDSQIDFLVASGFADAARLLPEINNLITLDRNEGWRGLLRLRRLLSRQYELIVDLQNSPRSAFLRLACMPLMWTKSNRFRIKRWFLIRFKWNFYGATVPVPIRYIRALDSLGVVDDELGLELLHTHGPRDEQMIVLCPGAKHFTKRWPVENWQELVSRLESSGWKITVCGSADEADACRSIAGNHPVVVGTALSDVGGLLARARAVVCHDSGLMHLATGVGTPVVALFGPTVEQFGFFPFRADALVVQQPLACRPCSAFGGNVCPKRHHDCMRQTTPDQVMSTLSQLLAIGHDRQTSL